MPLDHEYLMMLIILPHPQMVGTHDVLENLYATGFKLSCARFNDDWELPLLQRDRPRLSLLLRSRFVLG